MGERITPNQVIAYNLRRARGLHGWTQATAAERLEPYLGKRWSRVVYSAAERSIAGKRIRRFSADEIVAFAAALELPVAFFFEPPTDAEQVGPEKATRPLSSEELGELARGDVNPAPQLEQRINRLREIPEPPQVEVVRRAEAEDWLYEVEQERDEWREEAWRCYIESGADPDGADARHLNPGEAIRAVRELREDYDAACNEAEWAHAGWNEAEAKLAGLREVVQEIMERWDDAEAREVPEATYRRLRSALDSLGR